MIRLFNGNATGMVAAFVWKALALSAVFVAAGVGPWASAGLAGVAEGSANAIDAALSGVWNTKEAGVKVFLKHAQNVTAKAERVDGSEPCLVFLLYSTTCPFSK